MTIAMNSASASESLSDSSRFRPLFLAAALWNFVGAMGLLFLDPLAELAWPGSGVLRDPIARQFAMMVFGLIAVLGVAYLLVGIEPNRNRGIVLTAAIGKPVVLGFGLYYSWGVGSLWLLGPAAGILVFTLSFWWFLISTRDRGEILSRVVDRRPAGAFRGSQISIGRAVPRQVAPLMVRPIVRNTGRRG